MCRYSDAAFAQYIFDSPVLFTPGVVANPAVPNSINWDGLTTYTIVSEIEPWVWALAGKVGRTTGKTWSQVMTTYANVNVKNTNKTMLCQSKAPYTSAPGDSGAAVLRAGSTLNLMGIHWGSGGWFSPIANIEYDLGWLSTCATGYPC